MGTGPNPMQAVALLPEEQRESLERKWLQHAIAWLKSGRETRTQRLRELAAALKNPEVRARFARIWQRASPERLLSDAALPEETALSREISVRLKRRMMPQLERELDLYSTFECAGLSFADADWIAGLSDEEIAPWVDLLRPSSEHLRLALRLVAARVAATALSRELSQAFARLWEDDPFDDLLHAVVQNPEDAPAIEEALLRCRMQIGVAHAQIEERGVSANLVFRLDVLSAQLERIEELLCLADGRADGRKFYAKLVRGFAEDHGIRAMLRSALNRLARRVVEHTGRTGEHCIAGSSSEWRVMGFGATGAGAITAFTALLKYTLASAPFAPFWIGVAQSLNYAASFLLMQSLGWMLASKMPSMTASTLASAMGKQDGMQEEVDLIAAITRTQFVVTIGNLLGAMPLAFAIDAFLRWKTGHSFLSEEAAVHGLRSMNPIASFTILFAGITGAFLWLSSLAAGWTANWLGYHRLPAAIASSRAVHRVTGARAAAKIGRIMDHGFSGAIGYIVLGFLLGLTPLVGAFAGIPLEVRHITLNGASVAYDISAVFHKADWSLFAWALAGVAVTGILNFTVSFALGLWLAIRARNLDTRRRITLVRALAREALRNPARFLWQAALSHEVARKDPQPLPERT
jgi:site-specific recombinase